jgi:hypothetical protein
MKSACLAILALISFSVTGCADRVLEPRASSVDAALNANASDAGHGRMRRPYRMLFIGNSLTYVNDLPAMVAGISRAAGDDPPLETEMVALPAYSLEDHLAEGSAMRAIERGDWDVVVLSQGPSTLPESRENLIQYTKIFAEKIRAVSARPALYGVWPEEERLYALPWGIASYRAAAESVDGMLFPAGLAWQTAWKTDPAFPLYGPDRFHPSVLGTYLAALVVYAEVRDKSPVGLPGTFETRNGTVTIPPAQALLAQKVAAAVTQTKKRPGKPWAARRGPHADTIADETIESVE